MNSKEISKRLEEIANTIKGTENFQFLEMSTTDAHFLVDVLKSSLVELEALKKPVYSDCSIPTSYCSNCSCGKKEALEGK